MKKAKFKHCEAIVFAPIWWDAWYATTDKHPKHPLDKGEVVYYLGEIPNVPSHCLIVKYSGEVVAMVHPEDFRKAKEEEL